MTRSIAVSTGLVAWLLLLGCESMPRAGGMKQAVDDYNAQRYSQSQQNASAIQANAENGQREDAAYVAGLCAYQLGDLNEAERRFLTAARSSNGETVAKAKVMLGEIRMDQKPARPRDAAALFVDAYSHLNGDDADKCAYHAAVAYQQAGDAAAARQWAARSGFSVATSNPGASSSKTNPQIAKSSIKRTAPISHSTLFTLQVGAFREKSRATQAADEAEKLASREGLGPVRLFPRRDERGETMYVVQFGSFATREAAATARTRVGRLQYIVAPATSAS